MKKLLFTCSLVFCLQVYAQPVQWPSAQGGNDHWYQAVHVSTGITWPAAQTCAENHSTHLATITSAAENQFVFNLSDYSEYWWPEPSTGRSIGPWLGGHQDSGAIEPGGSWQWLNNEGYFMDVAGTPSLYVNWIPGEPNDALPLLGNENALHFLDRSNGWNDFPENGRTLDGIYYTPHGFVVESETLFATLNEDLCNVVPFSGFTPSASMKLGPKPNDDSFKVSAKFGLGEESDGINPVTEDVTVKFGSFSTTIPAGNFQQHGSEHFTFNGTLNKVGLKVDIHIPQGNSRHGHRPSEYSFDLKAKGANLDGTVLPPEVQLTIGDDSGSAKLNVGEACFGLSKNCKHRLHCDDDDDHR